MITSMEDVDESLMRLHRPRRHQTDVLDNVADRPRRTRNPVRPVVLNTDALDSASDDDERKMDTNIDDTNIDDLKTHKFLGVYTDHVMFTAQHDSVPSGVEQRAIYEELIESMAKVNPVIDSLQSCAADVDTEHSLLLNRAAHMLHTTHQITSTVANRFFTTMRGMQYACGVIDSIEDDKTTEHGINGPRVSTFIQGIEHALPNTSRHIASVTAWSRLLLLLGRLGMMNDEAHETGHDESIRVSGEAYRQCATLLPFCPKSKALVFDPPILDMTTQLLDVFVPLIEFRAAVVEHWDRLIHASESLTVSKTKTKTHATSVHVHNLVATSRSVADGVVHTVLSNILSLGAGALIPA